MYCGPKRPTPRFVAAMANLKSRDIEMTARSVKASAKAKKAVEAPAASKYGTWAEDDRVGAFAPFGYWDPLGLATGTSAGQLAYFREAELKHGRVCMLASLGFIVQKR